MRLRKPRIRIGKKGVRLTNVGARIGGKRAGINLSRRGASGSFKLGRASYNTRRGCSLPFFLLALAVALGLFLADQTRAQDGDTVYLPIVVRPQPTPTPSPTPIPPSNLDITALVYEGSDEYVEIRNNGLGGQDMTGWYLVSVVGPQTYYFPAMTVGPGQTVRIHSGPGAFSSPPAHLFWTSAFVWNNAGDKAELRTSSGNLVDSLCYGNGCP